MRSEEVEIYSDASNAAIMRHPGRRFPGVLVQGDSLSIMVGELRAVMAQSDRLDEDAQIGLQNVFERLEGLLGHYGATLKAHAIKLPYSE